MLHVGLDLSRSRIDAFVVDDAGEQLEVLAVPFSGEGLTELVARVGVGEAVSAVVESMTGARFVHDRLEDLGWSVAMADARVVRSLASPVAKTDRSDARLLAWLSQRDLVPEVWLPSPQVRGMRERARFRLHLVKRRTAVKNRVHSTLVTFGIPCAVSDLFGVAGRELLEQLEVPEPWKGNVTRCLEVIDHLDHQIGEVSKVLLRAEHRYLELLQTAPGIGPVLGYTIAAEIGDIARFASPKKLVGYTGLCPRVEQSGRSDRRGSLTKHGPKWLRWALIEATIHAARHPAYAARYTQTRRRLGPQRGPKVARIEVARRLATAIWHMLTHQEPFAPVRPHPPLAA